MSTPTKPSPLREDITKAMEELNVEEVGETTPTQATFSGIGKDDNDSYPDTPTPAGTGKHNSLIVVGGQIRKSASAINLQTRPEDDVFGPTTVASASGIPGVINVGTAVPSQEAIDALNRKAMAMYKAARGYNGFRPREDRGLEPTAANAQGIFPPDANVFVANLSNQRSEEQLELACHSVFDVFGPNYVKIKTDKNKHPFALVQFESSEAAAEAIEKAQGAIIDGRQVRLEHAKAERAVIISKVSGNPISEAEAREILGQYGAIDYICPTSTIRGRAVGLPQGVYVRFAFYLDCRDALRSFFHQISEYRLQLASGIEPQLRYDQEGSSTAKVLIMPRSVTDTKSIFVGNLPESVTKEQLMSEFEQFGTIVDANVIHKNYPGGSINIFGFVEFTTPMQATAAIAIEKYIGDNKLRIEPKEYSARRASRFNQLPVTPPVRTPRRVSPSANAALAMRLARNNVENSFTATEAAPTFIPPTPAYGYPPDEWQTPHHYIPAHLFSPSPTNQMPWFGMPGGDGYYHGGY